MAECGPAIHVVVSDYDTECADGRGCPQHVRVWHCGCLASPLRN